MPYSGNVPVIRTALVSVSDKTGIVPFCSQLAQLDVEILSTGGTARLLTENGIAVKDVSSHTGFPEIMGGRVKTLHPTIHGGILGRLGQDEAVMADNGITPIELVVVNLYPFASTIANPDCDLETAIENIDIGGPAMLRAAAKNHARVTVIVDQNDYQDVLDSIKANQGRVTNNRRFSLARKAFAHTANYDCAVSDYLGTIGRQSASDSDRVEQTVFPESYTMQFRKRQDMRYGENPHQSAAFYVDAGLDAGSAGIASAMQLQGKALSYNNIADTDAALECVKQFDGASAACVIVKHANPCGVAIARNQTTAYERAFSTDTESAFGGIIAFNQPLDASAAEAIVSRQFVEVIIAPGVTDAAKEIVATRDNVRLLTCASFIGTGDQMEFRRVNGGLLIQSADNLLFRKLEVVTRRRPSDTEMDDLLFAMKVAKFVKSNAIIYANDLMTIGVGAGQMSRVNSARIAAIKAQHAGLSVSGAIMASDAFFPFRDGLDNAAENGIRAVIQPGGSMRDNEVIEAADEHNIAMVFTGTRHFRH